VARLQRLLPNRPDSLEIRFELLDLVCKVRPPAGTSLGSSVIDLTASFRYRAIGVALNFSSHIGERGDWR
jgi:hypothetical protein